jgi:serine/threonine protein kinase
VLDLGLAIVRGEEVVNPTVVGGQGYIVGTMDYIAPEQTTDAAGVDARSDVYGLGCTLYFALTGQPPFPGGTSQDKVRRQRNEEPTPLRQLRPDLPPAFAALVQRLMAKDPAARLPSARAAEAELRAWIETGPTLPLDEPGDESYTSAVEELQTTEPSFSDSLADLPVAELLPDGRGHSRLVLWLTLGFAGLAGLAFALGVWLLSSRGIRHP